MISFRETQRRDQIERAKLGRNFMSIKSCSGFRNDIQLGLDLGSPLRHVPTASPSWFGRSRHERGLHAGPNVHKMDLECYRGTHPRTETLFTIIPKSKCATMSSTADATNCVGTLSRWRLAVKIVDDQIVYLADSTGIVNADPALAFV